MNYVSIVRILTFVNLFLVFAGAQAAPPTFPHILPDSPSSEYRRLYQPQLLSGLEDSSQLQTVISLGERNLAWLTHMNSFRPEGQKIQLTRPGDLKGIPIDAPKRYSPATISAEHVKIKEGMPAEMASVLYEQAAFTNDVPVAEETYVEWAKQVDKNYQSAVRWTMMAPYLPYLEMRRSEDLRGYYHLTRKTDNVEGTLRNFNTLAPDQQATIRGWLIQMCQNRDGLLDGCGTKIEASIRENAVFEFYQRYLPASEKIWTSYFSLENPRSEIVWSSQKPNVMKIPFRNPLNNVILDFLKLNIEDEFRWDLWNIELNFVSDAPIHVEFQPGVTPNVNGAGGDTITMDANSPLTEWDTQWTIRHEFGHVLGFVDCYLEFYEPTEKVIINYQLDIEHLMCARSGRMQKSIYDTLKAYYYR